MVTSFRIAVLSLLLSACAQPPREQLAAASPPTVYAVSAECDKGPAVMYVAHGDYKFIEFSKPNGAKVHLDLKHFIIEISNNKTFTAHTEGLYDLYVGVKCTGVGSGMLYGALVRISKP